MHFHATGAGNSGPGFLYGLDKLVPKHKNPGGSDVAVHRRGNDEGLPKVESRIGRLLSPYAFSKRMDEELADMAWRIYGLAPVLDGPRF
jgi:hypothetical protein